MRRALVVFVFLMASLFFALPSLAASSASSTTTTTTTIRPALAPTPANLQAFVAPSACAQHPGMPNCAVQVGSGLMLFAWTCAGCDPSWSALFVVNGIASAPGDINLAPSKLLALSVRPNQFKSTDCVAVRIFNPTSPAQNATSNAICLTQVLAIHAITPLAPGAPGGNIHADTVHSGTNPGLSPGVILNPNFVPAPTGMGITHDAPTCTAHGGFGGGLACTAGLQAGLLALIWNCPSCKVDGYRLYRVDGGRHDAQPSNGAYGNDATITLALLNPPGDGFNGKCYAVTAYKGPNESALSNWACAGAGSTATTTTLSPTHTLHWEHYRESRTGTIGYTHAPFDNYDANLYVGYADHYGENPFGDIYDDQFHRSGVVFDLSALGGHPISKAMLKLSALSSWHDYDNTDYSKTGNLSALSPMACVAVVDLATDHWWQNNDLNSTVSYLAPGGYMGPDFSIDVTTAVAKWTGNAAPPNFGFVLRGDDENDLWHGNTNHVCLTQLQSASLVVTYY
jgi:hypothetical protein